ncbi:MAG: hypothetical protein KGJ62_08235 [Armatimonadetes bacterium]|nr:hypothetical protein [Armatimonadota bacterium]MDE2205265.1 hypothetical protein [Armatimonadota bacterium]
MDATITNTANAGAPAQAPAAPEMPTESLHPWHGSQRAAQAVGNDIPDCKDLIGRYDAAIRLIERYEPLRAARLRDRALRAADAEARLSGVRSEEAAFHLQYVEHAKAQAASHRIEMDNLQTKLQSVRTEARADLAELRNGCEETYAQLAAAAIDAGLPIPVCVHRSVGGVGAQMDDPDDSESADIPEPEPEVDEGPNAPSAEPMSSRSDVAPARARRRWNWLGRWRRPDPTTPSASVIEPTPHLAVPPLPDGSGQTSRPVPTESPEDDFERIRRSAERRTETATVLAQRGGFCIPEQPDASKRSREVILHMVSNIIFTVACGTVLGLSLCAMIGFNIRQMLEDGEWASISGPVILGIFLFWLFGRVIDGGTERCASACMNAALCRDPERAEAWRRLGWPRLAALILTVGVIIAITSIEICVDKEGIVRFINMRGAGDSAVAVRQANGRVALQQVPLHLGWLVQWLLAAFAVVPFVALHVATAWERGFHEVKRSWYESERARCVHTLAEKLLAESERATEDKPVADLVFDRQSEAARDETSMLPPADNRPIPAVVDPAQTPEPTPGAGAVRTPAPRDYRRNGQYLLSSAEVPDRTTSGGVPRESASNLLDRLAEYRQALYRRNAAKQYWGKEILALRQELERVQALRPVIPQDYSERARARMDAAWADLQHAVHAFDDEYGQCVSMMHAKRRPGRLRAIARRFWGAPEITQDEFARIEPSGGSTTRSTSA